MDDPTELSSYSNKGASTMSVRSLTVTHAVFLLFVSILSHCHFGTCILIRDLSVTSYQQLGDLNFGVLLPVHSYNLHEFCAEEVRDLGTLQRIEAVAYAVREINNRTDLLPNHTLGFIMFDDCYKDITALAQALHFIEQDTDMCSISMNNTYCQADSLELYHVVGLLGSEPSTATVQVANLYSSLRLPQVSYLSTSPILNNRYRYGHFVRMVPSDVHQIRAIMALLRHFNWTYVNVIYAEGYYGGEGYKELLHQAAPKDGHARVCFKTVFELKRSFQLKDYKEMIMALLTGSTISPVIIVYTPMWEGLELLKVAKSLNVENRFTWIATDAWARNTRELGDYEAQMLGGISVNIDSSPVKRFNDYFKNIGPATPDVNPWIDEFWEAYFSCTKDINCNISQTFADSSYYFPDALISLVFDAVYSIAHGLQDAMNSPQCSNFTSLSDIADCADIGLRDALSQTNFMGETQGVLTDETGSVARSYIIQNLQNVSGVYTFVDVAKWTLGNDTLQFTGAEFQWAKGEVPVSICSSPCTIGQIPMLWAVACCWTCENCSENQRVEVFNDNYRCVDCPNGTWPNQTYRNSCVPIVPDYLDIHDNVGVMLATLAIFGLVGCAVSSIIFITNNRHPLIKSSSRELSYLMLGGLSVSFLSVFCYLMVPTSPVCFLRGLSWGLCFTLMYAPLVTKTIRILRIFKAGNELKRNPICVNSMSQIGIAVNIILLHLFLLVGLMNARTPEACEDAPTADTLVLTCTFDQVAFILSLVYNVGLLFSSVYCAYRSRKLPDNFNESKFISFCVHSTVIIQLSFILAYFTVGDALFESMFMCLSIIFTGYLILLCVFAPKIYALYFVDEEHQHVTVKRYKQKDACNCRPVDGGGVFQEGRDLTLHSSACKTSQQHSSVEAISMTVAPLVNIDTQGTVHVYTAPATQTSADRPDLIASNPISLVAESSPERMDVGGSVLSKTSTDFLIECNRQKFDMPPVLMEEYSTPTRRRISFTDDY